MSVSRFRSMAALAVAAVMASSTLAGCSSDIPGRPAPATGDRGGVDASGAPAPGSSGENEPARGSTHDGTAARGPATSSSADPADQPGHAHGPRATGPGLDTSHVLPPEEISTTWDISPKQDAVILDYDLAAAALIGYDTDASTWIFDSDAIAPADLAEGDALLVAGRGLGRITQIAEQDGHTVVATSEASLADVIDNGTMAWEAPLGFGPQWFGSADADAPGLRSPHIEAISMVDAAGQQHPGSIEIGDNSVTWSETLNGVEYTLQVTAAGDTAEVKVQAHHDQMTYKAVGTVGRAVSSGKATYADGELAGSTVRQNDISGSLTLSVAAVGGLSGNKNITIPGLMITYVVPVGPVPVTVTIGAQMLVKAEIPVKASATFESNFSYSGSAGISYDGPDVDASAQLGMLKMDPKAADPASLIGATVNAEFGIAFPRATVSIFDIGLVPYIEPGLTIGTSMTWGPACKRAYVKTSVIAGYDLTILGVKLSSGKETLFEKKRDAAFDDCS